MMAWILKLDSDFCGAMIDRESINDPAVYLYQFQLGPFATVLNRKNRRIMKSYDFAWNNHYQTLDEYVNRDFNGEGKDCSAVGVPGGKM